MSQQESIVPRQSTRTVTATRRREMAEERARILGRSRTLPSALEVAAAQWAAERRAREREAKEEKLRSSRAAEAHPFSLHQVSLDPFVLPWNEQDRVKYLPPDDELGWKAYVRPREAKPRRRRLGGIPVGSFATQVIQRERAVGGRIEMDPRAWALEEAARRWEEQRKASSSR